MERMDPLLYDCDIREPLFDYLEERFGKARMFEEKIIGKSRADVLMVTEGRITGLEIKSDADTYERLKRQVRDYDKFFDDNYIVIGKSHAMHVEEHIPEYWGVLLVSVNGREIVIEEVRPAKQNPNVKRELQLTLLWRVELQNIIERNHLPHYRQKSKRFVREKLLEKVEWEKLKAEVCEELFERDYTLLEAEPEEEGKGKEKSGRSGLL